MKLPQFSFRKDPQKSAKQDDEVFAEASELAMLRLEQCMADSRIPLAQIEETTRPRGLHSLRKNADSF